MDAPPALAILVTLFPLPSRPIARRIGSKRIHFENQDVELIRDVYPQPMMPLTLEASRLCGGLGPRDDMQIVDAPPLWVFISEHANKSY
jgi:hypothetical protein